MISFTCGLYKAETSEQASQSRSRDADRENTQATVRGQGAGGEERSERSEEEAQTSICRTNESQV